MEADTVQPELEEQEEVFEQPVAVEDTAADSKETQVPLAALQKERKKRQELEYENQLLKDQYVNRVVPPVDDGSQYETVTRADLGRHSEELVRALEEKHWVKHNAEKAQMVNERLSEFLKQKPYLAEALKNAPNRYEEAWELMNALTPKQQNALTKPAPQKREGPGAVNTAPKAAAMNQAVDLMAMSDTEFYAWRKAQKRR